MTKTESMLRAEREKLMDALSVMKDKEVALRVASDSIEFMLSALERKDVRFCQLATSLLKKDIEDKWK